MWMTRRLALAFAVVPWHAAVVRAEPPAPSTCMIQPDKTVPVRPGPGRIVSCGIDLGSKSARLSVVSLEKSRSSTIRDERQCKRTLGMGALVFDSKANKTGPLPDDAIGLLVETIREYQTICALDAGILVAAGATQWARDATNIADVQARVKAQTGVEFAVLNPKQEAEQAYVAAAIGAPGRIVLDPGSNSFELAWQEKGSTEIRSILVPYGYVRGAGNDFETAADFPTGRAAYQAKTREKIDAELAKLTPPSSLASLRQQMAHGELGPEIVTLGQDGAVYLWVRGLLRRSDGGWIAESKAYDEVLARQVASTDPSFGPMAAVPVSPSELSSYLMGIQRADFKALTSDPIRGMYGQKALVVPSLVDLLFRELNASRLVMVPQESATGQILRNLTAAP
jgi:Ppx/GppA phosphatase family